MIDDFDTQADAINSLKNVADEHGEDELLTLSLLHINGEQQTLIAMENTLLELVKNEILEMATSSTA